MRVDDPVRDSLPPVSPGLHGLGSFPVGVSHANTSALSVPVTVVELLSVNPPVITYRPACSVTFAEPESVMFRYTPGLMVALTDPPILRSR